MSPNVFESSRYTTSNRVPSFVGPPQGGYTSVANQQETYGEQPNNTMLYVAAAVAVAGVIYFAMK
jgi:hypothetical protein